MPDRRQHFRTETTRAAELRFRPRLEKHDCIVVDVSDGGIQIVLDEPMGVPDELTIRFGDGASRWVRRCWSSGTRIGLQFIEPAARLHHLPGPGFSASPALPDEIAAVGPANQETWQAVGIVKLMEFAIRDFQAAGRNQDAIFLSEIKTNISLRFPRDLMATNSGGKMVH